MTQKEHIAQLKTVIGQVSKSVYWLNISYDKCSRLDFQSITVENFELLEALSTRFARASDITIKKLFRTIDILEFAEGTLLDALNRAEKRGLIESVEDIRKIRDLRNTIAHDYAAEDIIDLSQEILKKTPILISIIKKSITYCEEKFELVL